MTISRTTRLVRTGRLHIEVKHEVHSGITEAPADAVVYNNVYAIPVYNIDMEKVAYWFIYTREEGYPLGKVTTLKYLEEANASEIKV